MKTVIQQFTYLILCLSALALMSFTTTKDTIDYRVFVVADQAGVKHFGGEEEYKKQLAKVFQNANNFWNKGSDKFQYYFRYVPELMVVYKGSSKVAENYFKHNIDSTRHDVFMIIDSQLDHEDENPGWYCYGGPDHTSVVCIRGRSKTEYEDLFDDKHYRGIAHEFGHYRGVTDLYADRIREKNNPVNHVGYEPDSCIMNNHHKTNHWSSYAVNIINHTALSKRPGRDFPGLFKQMFPKNIQITVKAKGKKKQGVKLNLYGSRAKFNDLIPTPYKTFETDKQGKCLITGVPDLYDQPAPPLHTDDLPYNRWFTFVLEAECNGKKQYVWLPEYEVQNSFFKNEDTYHVTIDFSK